MVHKLGAVMAVDADHPLLLVDVRDQLMVFNPIGANRRFIGGCPGEVGGPVFFVEVMLKTAMIIGTHPVSVVTLQALLVGGGSQESMGDRRAVAKVKVTGRAPGAVPHKGIGIAAGVGMAAQTTPAQEVVRQLQGRFRNLVNGDLGEVVERCQGAKGLSRQIDLAGQGKMNGLRNPCCLVGMAGPAGLDHGCRMGGPGDEIKMGGLLVIAGVVAAMTV